MFICQVNQVERVTKGDSCDEQYQHKLPHILDNLNNHSNQIARSLKDPKKVEELEPHEECSDWLPNTSEFFTISKILWRINTVINESQEIEYNTCNNEDWWDQINVIPNGGQVGQAMFLELNDLK